MNDNASRLKNKPCVGLIGLRGCGKSTVGAELAGLRGGACLDANPVLLLLALPMTLFVLGSRL